MSASKKRELRNLRRQDGKAFVDVETIRGSGAFYQHEVSELPRPEVNSVAKMAFPSIDGRRWFGAEQTVVIRAIRSGEVPDNLPEVPERYRHKGKYQKQGGTPREVPMPNVPRHDVPQPDPYPQGWTPGEQGEGQGQGSEQGQQDGGQEQGKQVDPADAVAEMLRQMMQGQQSPLDEDRVRVIANEETDKRGYEETLASLAEQVEAMGDREPRVLVFDRIKIGDQPERDLPKVHHSALPEVLAVVAAGNPHVWLSGPAGTGKSTIAEQVAETLGLAFWPFSAGPADMPSKVFGFVDANGVYHRTPIRDAVEHGGLLGFDEIDSSNPGCLTALNLLLAARPGSKVPFPDGPVVKSDGMVVIASANTWGTGPDREYVGRCPLDAATLNRFPVAIEVDYDPALDRYSALRWAPEGDTEAEARLEGWLTFCIEVRRRANDERIPLIVSPRNIDAGASLLAVGFTPQRVADIVVFPRVSADIRAKVDANIAGYVR